MEDTRKETMEKINAEVVTKKVNEIITFTDQLKTKVVEQDAKIVALENKVMAQAALLNAATKPAKVAPPSVPVEPVAAPPVAPPVETSAAAPPAAPPAEQAPAAPAAEAPVEKKEE